MKQNKLTWADFDAAVESLAAQLRVGGVNNNWRLYGEPRGGLCLAVALSHRLGIPLTSDAVKEHHPVIWVDDIVETGRTLTEAIKILPIDTYFCAWMTVGYHNRVITAERKPDESWLIFPWEDEGAAQEDCVRYLASRGLTCE